MGLFSQLVSALVSVSPLFVIGAGLTSSIGATGSANLSLGALAVLGAFLAHIVAAPPEPATIALAILAAIAAPAALGIVIDIVVLRRLRGAPVLSMLATLGIALLIAALVPSRPTPLLHDWFGGAIDLFGASISIADIVQIVVGPVVYIGFLLIQRWGWAVRGSAALAAGAAGLAGALLAARASSNTLEPTGSGLLTGGILVALLVQPAKLIRDAADRSLEWPLVRATPASMRLLGVIALAVAAAAPLVAGPSALTVLDEALTAILFAASLQMLFGPGAMPSLGHGVFFAIGAIAAALTRDVGTAGALLVAPIAAGAAALVAGALLVWLPGVIIAMLTLALGWLALAQLGSGWILALIPLTWVIDPALAYWFTLTLCLGGVLLLRRVLSSPFGYALRASRDDPRRAVAIGVPVQAVRLAAFVIAGSMAGLAGALAAAAAGRLPANLGNLSFDGVLMVLLGGMQTLSGPIVGALAVTGLRQAAHAVGVEWEPSLGLLLIAVVTVLPDGVAGWSMRQWRRGC